MNSNVALEENPLIEYVMKPSELCLSAILVNGFSDGSKRPREDYLKEGYIIGSSDYIMGLLKKNQDEAFLTPWRKIDKKRYYQCYEELPPLKLESSEEATFFRSSEAFSGDIHSVYCEYNGKYYSTARRLSTPYCEMLQEIKAQITEGTLK